MTKEKIILGIDPGTIIMGYGILAIRNNKPYMETMGILKLEQVLGLLSPFKEDI